MSDNNLRQMMKKNRIVRHFFKLTILKHFKKEVSFLLINFTDFLTPQTSHNWILPHNNSERITEFHNFAPQMNTWYAYSSLHRTYIGNNHTPKLNSMNAILHLIAARIGQIKAMRCSASHAANSRIFAFVRIVTLLRPLCLPHSKQKMA